MNQCDQCGKSMATRGGLEIHMEMVHAVAPAVPVAAAAAASIAVPAPPQPAGPQSAVAVPRAAAGEWQLPRFLRGIDPTLPLTALLVVALFLAGVVAAVHRTSAGPPAAVHGVTPAAAAAPPVAIDAAADQKFAQSLILTPTDYPDGWTFTPHPAIALQADSDRLLAACLGLPDLAATKTADAFGPDAQAGGGQQAATRVVVMGTGAEASNFLTAVGEPSAVPCVKQELTRSVEAGGVAVADVGVGRFALETGTVHSVALHSEVAAKAGGVLSLDAVFLHQGRVCGEAVFVSTTGQFPVDTEQTLVTRFAHKLASA